MKNQIQSSVAGRTETDWLLFTLRTAREVIRRQSTGDKNPSGVVDLLEVEIANREKLTPAQRAMYAAAPAMLAELESLRKVVANALDNCPYLFPDRGIKANLSPEAAAWRTKLETASRSARAVIQTAKGGS